MQLSADLLQRATGCTRGTALTWGDPLREACDRFAINTPVRLAAFLAQCGHESAGFTRTVENLKYSAAALLRTWPSRFTPELAEHLARNPDAIANHVYGQRLGNVEPGDGWRFIGRGLIQLTGRANYAAMRDTLAERLGRDRVPDFTQQPTAVAEPRWAALTAGAFWHERGLNALAEAGRFTDLTRRINNRLLGLDDRKARFAKALRVLEAA